MDEALAGHRGSWRRTTRPATWLRDYWLQEPARAPLAEGADGGNARARSP